MVLVQGGVWVINPLQDDRWSGFVDRHPNSSLFHTIGWLKALRSTYGYEPVAFTTSAPSEDLTNALLVCVVQSLLTRGRQGGPAHRRNTDHGPWKKDVLQVRRLRCPV